MELGQEEASAPNDAVMAYYDRRESISFTALFMLTLIHMQSENGRVAMMRRMDTRAKRRAQHPGPSGSAVKKGQHCHTYSIVERKAFVIPLTRASFQGHWVFRSNEKASSSAFADMLLIFLSFPFFKYTLRLADKWPAATRRRVHLVAIKANLSGL